MKKETRRLVRVGRETKQENERLVRETSRLREENACLLARNARLDARNLQVRREIETVSERNRKLLSTLQRELLGNISSNSADASGGRKAAAAAEAVGLKTFVPTASSLKLEENTHSIVVPNPSRSSRDSSSSGGGGGVSGSGRNDSGTHRRRRRRRSEHSDAEEIVTPRSTAPTGRSEPEAADAAAATEANNNADGVSSTTIQGEGRVEVGWHMATEAVEAAHAARHEAGSAGATPSPPQQQQQQQSYSDGSQSNRGGRQARDEPGTEEEGPLVGKKDQKTSARDHEAVPGQRSSGRPSRAAAGAGAEIEVGAGAATAAARPGEAVSRQKMARSLPGEHRRRVESNGDRATDTGSTCSATFSAGVSDHDADHREASPLPPPLPPNASAASTQSKRPTFSALATSKPTVSFPSGRKRSRLSLGGGGDDKGPAWTGHSVEITEVLEAPRPRSATAAAGPAAAAGAGARGKAWQAVSAAGARRRASPSIIQSFPGALLAAERMGSSRGGTGRRAGGGGGGGEISGDVGRATKQPGVSDQRGPKRQTPVQQLQQQTSRIGVGLQSTQGSGTPSMRVSRKRSESGDARNGRDTVAPASGLGQPGPRDGAAWLDKKKPAARDGGEEDARLVTTGGRDSGGGGGGGGGSADSGTATTTALHDVIYPRLTMAAVNSPAKKKPRARRQRQQQPLEQQDQDAAKALPSSSSDSRGTGRRREGPTSSAAAAPAAAADLGRGRDEKRRHPASGSLRKGADRGGKRRAGAGADAEAGADGDAVEERENSPPPRNRAHGGSANRHRREGAAATTSGTYVISPTKCTGDDGGGDRTGAAAGAAAAAAAAAAAEPVARHQSVVNPYATGINRNGGAAAAAAAGAAAGGGKRACESSTKGYKFQEVRNSLSLSLSLSLARSLARSLSCQRRPLCSCAGFVSAPWSLVLCPDSVALKAVCAKPRRAAEREGSHHTMSWHPVRRLVSLWKVCFLLCCGE